MGTSVSVGTSVQVAGGAFHTDVGEGPGVLVGKGVLLGVGDSSGTALACTVGGTRRGVVLLDEPRASLTTMITMTAAAANTIRMKKFVMEMGASWPRARNQRGTGGGGVLPCAGAPLRTGARDSGDA